MFNEMINNISTKPLTEFSLEDTIYIEKISSGMSVTIFCSFVELRKGVVIAKVKRIFPKYWSHTFPIGSEVTARVSKCFLFGKRSGDKYERCYWFEGKTKTAQ